MWQIPVMSGLIPLPVMTGPTGAGKRMENRADVPMVESHLAHDTDDLWASIDAIVDAEADPNYCLIVAAGLRACIQKCAQIVEKLIHIDGSVAVISHGISFSWMRAARA